MRQRREKKQRERDKREQRERDVFVTAMQRLWFSVPMGHTNVLLGLSEEKLAHKGRPTSQLTALMPQHCAAAQHSTKQSINPPVNPKITAQHRSVDLDYEVSIDILHQRLQITFTDQSGSDTVCQPIDTAREILLTLQQSYLACIKENSE